MWWEHTASQRRIASRKICFWTLHQITSLEVVSTFATRSPLGSCSFVFVNDIGGQFLIRIGARDSFECVTDNQIWEPCDNGKREPPGFLLTKKGLILTFGEQCLLVLEAVLSEPVLGIITRCEYT